MIDNITNKSMVVSVQISRIECCWRLTTFDKPSQMDGFNPGMDVVVI